MTELFPETSGEVDHGGPQPMQRLEVDRRPFREQPEHGRVVDLVGDLRSDAASARESRAVDDDTVLRHSQERCSERAAREQLVDRVQVEEIPEPGRQLGRGREERTDAPRVGEAIDVRDAPGEGPAVVDRALAFRRRLRCDAHSLLGGAIFRATVRTTVGPAVCTAVGAAISATVGSAVVLSRDSLGAAVRRPVRAAIGATVGSAVVLARDSLGAAVRRSVRAAIGATVGSAVVLARGALGAPVCRSVLVL